VEERDSLQRLNELYEAGFIDETEHKERTELVKEKYQAMKEEKV
jgi:hypothetical protein